MNRRYEPRGGKGARGAASGRAGQQQTNGAHTLDDVVEAAPVGICWIDDGGAIRQPNAFLRALLGDDIAGTCVQSIGDDAVVRALEQLRRGEALCEHALALRGADGKPRDLLLDASPGTGGAPATWFVRDVTSYRKLEETYQLRLRALAEELPVNVYAFQPDGEMTYANQHWLRFTGLTFDEARDWTNRPIIHADDRAELMARWARALETGEPYVHQSRVRRYDGVYRWHTAYSLPQRDVDGAISGWIAISVDVDDQKRAEAAVRESEARYRTLAEAMPAMMLAASTERRDLYFNERFFEYTGKGRTELEADGWTAIIDADDLRRVEPLTQQTRETEELLEDEIRVRRHDGVYRWHLLRGVPLRNGDGRVYMWLVTLIDIHDRRLAEERVAVQAHLLDSVEQAAIGTTVDGTITYWNRYAEKMYGWRIDDVLGRNIFDVTVPDTEAARSSTIMSDLAGGDGWTGEITVRRRDGSTFPALVTNTPVLDDAGNVTGIIGVSRDITEERAAREAIAESERRYRALAESSPMLVWTVRTGGVVEYFNERWFAYTGLSKTQPLAHGWEAAVHPEELSLFIERRGARPTAEAFEIEARLRRADGAYRWHLSHIAPLEYENGVPVRWLRTAIDIHDRRTASEALEHQYERQRLITEAARAINATLSLTDTLETITQRAREIIGAQIAVTSLTSTDAPPAVIASSFANEYAGADDVAADAMNERISALVAGSNQATGGGRRAADESSPRDAVTAPLVGRDGRNLGVLQLSGKADGGDFDEQDEAALGQLAQMASAAIQNAQLYEEAQTATLITEEARAQLDMLIESSPVGIGFWDEEFRFVRVNDALATTNGIAPEAHIGHSIEELLPDLWSKVQPYADHVMKTGESVTDVEITGRTPAAPDEERAWLANYYPVRRPNGRIVGMGAMVLEITERQRIEAQLESALRREGEARYLLDTLVTTAPVGIVFFDRDLRYQRVNSAAAEINGRTVEEHLGRALYEVLPDMNPSVGNDLRRVMETGEPLRDVEVMGETPAAPGALRYYLAGYYPVRSAGGTIDGVACIFSEITERKRAEAALAESEARYRSLTAALPAIVSMTNARGEIAYFNERFYEFSGLDVEASFERPWPAIMHPDDYPRAASAWEHSFSTGEPLEVEARLRRRDGAYRWFLARMLPIMSAGRVMGWVLGAIDIEERKQSDAERDRLLGELRSALAAKDEFLGLVSHELRTPITTILGNAEVLHRRGENIGAEMRQSALSDVANEADRLSRIIDNLLTLARLERSERIETEPIVVKRLVERATLSHRRNYPYRTIEIDVAGDETPAIGEPTSIEQVLRNFLSNAEKYSPREEPISLTLRHEGGELHVIVGDRGDGVPADEAEAIFTPFYRSPRTASQAGGAGIGLAVCRKLIEAQGGRIWARPREGGGSDFGFALPLVEDGEA